MPWHQAEFGPDLEKTGGFAASAVGEGRVSQTEGTAQSKDTVFVSYCHCNKSPQIQMVKQHKLTIIQFWRSEVGSGSHWAKSQGVRSVAFLCGSSRTIFLPFLSSRDRVNFLARDPLLSSKPAMASLCSLLPLWHVL